MRGEGSLQCALPKLPKCVKNWKSQLKIDLSRLSPIYRNPMLFSPHLASLSIRIRAAWTFLPHRPRLFSDAAAHGRSCCELSSLSEISSSVPFFTYYLIQCSVWWQSGISHHFSAANFRRSPILSSGCPKFPDTISILFIEPSVFKRRARFPMVCIKSYQVPTQRRWPRTDAYYRL